jgi:hypothetical protein
MRQHEPLRKHHVGEANHLGALNPGGVMDYSPGWSRLLGMTRWAPVAAA